MGDIRECWSICGGDGQEKEGERKGEVGRGTRWKAHYMNQEYDDAQIWHWR